MTTIEEERDLSQDPIDTTEITSIIPYVFDTNMLKKIFFHCTRVDIEDNNEKAQLLTELLHDTLGFDPIELGVGTNRVAYQYRGLCWVIALDRRGMMDNWTEFKRSQENPGVFMHAYETNMLILVEEYVHLLDQELFRINAPAIREILRTLSKTYIFSDIGFDEHNFANWGYRTNHEEGESGDLVILDLGYVYPIAGNERALTCPVCGAELGYDTNYTHFQCQNPTCRSVYSVTDIRRRMDLSLENAENRMISYLNEFETPDFETLLGADIIVPTRSYTRIREDSKEEEDEWDTAVSISFASFGKD